MAASEFGNLSRRSGDSSSRKRADQRISTSHAQTARSQDLIQQMGADGRVVVVNLGRGSGMGRADHVSHAVMEGHAEGIEMPAHVAVGVMERMGVVVVPAHEVVLLVKDVAVVVDGGHQVAGAVEDLPRIQIEPAQQVAAFVMKRA